MKTFTFAINRPLTDDENQPVFDWFADHDEFVKIFPTFWVFRSALSCEQLHSHLAPLLPRAVQAVICEAGDLPEFVGVERRGVGWLWSRRR